jgi:hypothetical protein
MQGAHAVAVVLPGEQRRGDFGMLKEAGLGSLWGQFEAVGRVRSNSERLVGSSSVPDSKSADSPLVDRLSSQPR